MLQQTNEDLGVIFDDLRQSLRNYLLKHIRDPELAEDLLQDVFVKALVSVRNERRIENLAGWLYAVARTTLIDHYRATRAPMEVLDENIAGAEPEDLRLHQELSACLRPFAEQLPSIYRDTLIATDFNGESMRSLADAQGLSVSAIKSRAKRGRLMLREKLLACCDIEMTGGLVSDYCRRPISAGGGKCT